MEEISSDYYIQMLTEAGGMDENRNTRYKRNGKKSGSTSCGPVEEGVEDGEDPKLAHLTSEGPTINLQAISANENTMLILQETWSDASGAMVIYAPIDLSSMSIVVSQHMWHSYHLNLQSFPMFHLVTIVGKVTPTDEWRIRMIMGL
ncbi:hypothetical protein GQ457_13G026170 [Hibiscus cannabinus]